MTALRMMEVMLEAKSDFASLHRDLIIYPQILKNVRVVDKNEVLDHPSVRQAIAQANEKLGNDGRTLVRPSGTEPVLRVMAEARQEGACAEAVDAIIGAIRDAGLLSQ